MAVAAPLRVIVHDVDHVRTALTMAADAEVTAQLFSAAGASAWLGAGYWAALEAEAREAFPDTPFSLVLDCADRAGDVQAALRAGCGAVRFIGPQQQAARLADIAGQQGALFVTDPLPATDLGVCDDPLAACRALICDDTRDGLSTGRVVTE